MLRKIFVPLITALLGFVAFSGIASAEPYVIVDPGTNAPDDVGIGAPFTVGLVDFLPGETIDVVGSYIDGPFGLRRASAMADGDLSFTAVADSNGAASVDVAGQKQGLILFVATGRTSGKSSSTTVQVGPATGGGSSVTTTTVVAADGSSTTVVAGAPGAVGGDGGGLAYTGASVAGPIAIGAAALLAGLAMLFFGTRGIIRRKGLSSNGR